MKTRVEDEKIIIEGNTYFNVNDTLSCGQLFRFRQNGDKSFTVNSLDRQAKIYEDGTTVIIDCNCDEDVRYFYNYFDLTLDLSKIASILNSDPLVGETVKKGRGIRLLRQDAIEMIFSFILSANNNIPRIKGIIDRLCNALGENKGNYHAFPTVAKLASCDEEFYKSIGCGYRADYLPRTARMIDSGFDLSAIDKMDTIEANKYLQRLKGVGEKVADCILLFGFHRLDAFPVDVWMERSFINLTGIKNMNRHSIKKFFYDKYGDNCGYVQQYIFHYFRNIVG